MASCMPKTRSKYQMKKVTRAFAAHLYIHYHKYSDRERKDNTGKFKGTYKEGNLKETSKGTLKRNAKIEI